MRSRPLNPRATRQSHSLDRIGFRAKGSERQSASNLECRGRVPTATVNSIELYYEVVDSSPHWIKPKIPLLFIHGLSTDHTIWEQQVATFKKDRPVITVDVRGHGRSAKPPGDVYEIADHTTDMLGLLRNLGYPKTHVIGVSMGGMIAQQMALRNPEL